MLGMYGTVLLGMVSKVGVLNGPCERYDNTMLT